MMFTSDIDATMHLRDDYAMLFILRYAAAFSRAICRQPPRAHVIIFFIIFMPYVGEVDADIAMQSTLTLFMPFSRHAISLFDAAAARLSLIFRHAIIDISMLLPVFADAYAFAAIYC